MSEVQFLFAVLVALYAWECACWLRRGGVALTTWTGRRWHIQHPAVMLGNQRGGFILAAPLPPLGSIFTANQLPFSLGPDGVLTFVSPTVNPGWRPPQTSRFLTWEETGRLRIDGKKLLLQNGKIISTSSVTLARYLLKSLTDIAKLSAEQREAAIKELLQAGLNLTEIESRRHDFDQQVSPIRFCANALFLLIFALTPLLIVFIGLKLIWPWWLIAVLGLTITTAVRFARLHRKFYPEALDDRFTHSLIIALAPATTMRAHDILSRPLLETFHPLAVAKQLLDTESFRSFARHQLLDLRNPVPAPHLDLHPQADATENFYRRTLLEVTEGWLAENKVPPDDLCRPPRPADVSCRAYCPRCEAQFTSSAGNCSDCGGLRLVPFRKPIEPGHASA